MVQTADFWHRSEPDRVLFEAYETAAKSAKVLESVNTLQWDFPGSSISIPQSKFSDPGFEDELSIFLEQASVETIEEFAARYTKAFHSGFESRDTVNPCLITEMLTTLLEANGQREYPVLTRKHVRDDVVFADGSYNPWRRAPFWLFLKVAVQRHLSRDFGLQNGRFYYKLILAQVLSDLLKDAATRLLVSNPEYSLPCEELCFLKTKLCRRMAKICASPLVKPDHSMKPDSQIKSDLFMKLESQIDRVVNEVSEQISQVWTSIKNRSRRRIPPLSIQPLDFTLSLNNSRQALQMILDEEDIRIRTRFLSPVAPSFKTKEKLQGFAMPYFGLAETELSRSMHDELPETTEELRKSCLYYATQISSYLGKVGDYYRGSPLEMSQMILTVMEMWVAMDKCATKLYPLLLDFKPGFPASICDGLLLLRYEDMRRLCKIQHHIAGRDEGCPDDGLTIFEGPYPDCFAERSFNQSSKLQTLHDQIVDHANRGKEEKMKEWKEAKEEYEGLIAIVQQETCLMIA